MQWSDLTFAYKQLFTHAKAQKIQDNITALAQGLTGAPEIETNAIKDLNVTQAKLNADVFAYVIVMTLVFD
jgi:hypothetical protein